MNNLARQKGDISIARIDRMIFFVRGQKVMFDRDLAELYGVLTKRLNEQVRRNSGRFPEDFMFQLSKNEFENWKSQFATSNLNVKMGLRKRPYAFTEQGVAMLSSVLHSDRAAQVNVEIIRTFVRLRKALASHQELTKATMTELRSFVLKDSVKTRQEIRRIWNVIEKLIKPADDSEKRRIGFSLD